MKKQVLAISLSLMALGSFAQKKELRTAEKAIKKNDFTTALTAIKSVESSIKDAKDKYKSQFYFLKGQALAGKKDFVASAEAFRTLQEFEKKTKRDRYSSKATPIVNDMLKKASEKAFNSYNSKDYGVASKNFYLVYKLSPKDTSFVHNAAISATQAKDYNTALKYYNELNNLGFTGISTQYVATNKSTGKVEDLGSKAQRDLMVKAGQYIKPEVRRTKSKKIEILKGIASSYKNLGKAEEAVKAYETARATDPDNIELLLSQAYLYNDLKQVDKFEALMKEAVGKRPNDPSLFFNLGVVSFNNKNTKDAIKFFSKSIELDSKFKDAHYMLANSYLEKDRGLVDKMNSLPANDMDGYTKVENERKALMKDSILPNLLKADSLNRTKDVVRLLKGVYQILGMDAESEKYKKIEESM